MNAPTLANEPSRTNGSGAAALLAAGLGSLILGVLTTAVDKSPAIKNALIFYKPTGALSGVTTIALLVWIASWVALDMIWKKKTLPLGRIYVSSLILLGLGLLLTFPPFIDCL